MTDKELLAHLRGQTYATTALIAALIAYVGPRKEAIELISASVAGARDMLIASSEPTSEQALSGFDEVASRVYAVLGQPFPPLLPTGTSARTTRPD